MAELKIEGVVEMLLSLCSRKYSDKERILMVTAWEHTLKEVSQDQLKHGLDKAIDTHDGFMMPPGKFKQLCLSSIGCRSIEDEAREAWALALKTVNSSIAPIFKDDCIAGAVNKLGGWVGFCRSITEDNKPFKEKEFVGFYVVCRNSKEKFCPLPDRVTKFMQNGKERPLYKFIGFDSKSEKKIAWTEVKRIKESQNKVTALIGNSRR